MLVACACEGRSTEVFELDGSRYSIPEAHLSSASRGPPAFIRIKHPEKPYDLVYDGRGQGAQHGPGVPRLFSVNDEGQDGVAYRKGPGGTIVCREAVNPKGGCGLRIAHKGVAWTLLFPIARAGEASRFEQDAAALLNGYAR